jgi:hypothetical protein
VPAKVPQVGFEGGCDPPRTGGGVSKLEEPPTAEPPPGRSGLPRGVEPEDPAKPDVLGDDSGVSPALEPGDDNRLRPRLGPGEEPTTPDPVGPNPNPGLEAPTPVPSAPVPPLRAPAGGAPMPPLGVPVMPVVLPPRPPVEGPTNGLPGSPVNGGGLVPAPPLNLPVVCPLGCANATPLTAATITDESANAKPRRDKMRERSKARGPIVTWSLVRGIMRTLH